MKYLKKQKGITLVALVVTIVILLILAGVSLNLVLGNQGLVTKANEGRTNYFNASEEELALLNNLSDAIDNYTMGEAGKKKQITENLGLKIGDVVTYSPEGTYEWKGEYATTAELIAKKDANDAPILDENENPVYETADDVLLDSRAANVQEEREAGAYRITSWKVLSLDDGNGNILLVPNTLPSATVKLQGAPGYNNAVKLLDDACSSLYSDISKGILARSIDMDDIEPMLDSTALNTAKANYSHTNSSYTYLNENEQVSTAYAKKRSYFPLLYELENKSVINGTEKSNGLGLNSSSANFIKRTDATTLEANQTTFSNATNGYLQAYTSIQPYQTYYGWSSVLTTAASYKSTFTSVEKTALTGIFNKTFWLASRCVTTYSNSCYFIVLGVGNGSLNYYAMFYSGNDVIPNSLALFPVVTISPLHIEKDGNNFIVE